MKILCLCGALALSYPAWANAESIPFDQTEPGQLPTGWTAASTGEGQAVWKVVRDDSCPSPPHALMQCGWSPNASFPLCAQTDSSLRNGFVEVKFKCLSGTNDQAAGVVWRYHDPNNYYVARANALENNVVLYKVEKGKRTALDIVGRAGGYGVKTTVSAQAWNTLRVVFRGTRFHVLLNGRELFAVEDATFAEPGSVGVWTKADSVTLFDDFCCGDEKQ